MVWGTDEQKDRFLGPILSADEIWCQGFSEPDAGSDLAALKTRAVRDGDGWVVTGQKVWTSGAQYSKWCMLVARTDPDEARHKGLTYFLMDMEQDAVQIRPLRQITGESEFNELFIEEARIADDQVVGGAGNGWRVAMTTLMNERAGLAFFLQVRLRNLLDDLIAEAAARGRLADDLVAERLGDAARAHRAAAAHRLPRPDRDREVRPARARGLADEVDVVRRQPAARPARRRHPRPRRARHGLSVGATSCCARAATRSRAGPPRSSRTSSPSACSACRGCADGLRLQRRAAADQGHGARAADRALALPARPRGGGGARRRRRAVGASCVALGWPGIAVAEEHGGQGLGAVELAILLEELGYAVAATPFLGTRARRVRDPARRERRAARPLAAGAGVRRADRRLRPARPRGRRRRRRRDRPRSRTAARG